MNKNMNRRTFIQNSQMTLAAATAFSILPATGHGANDRLRVGVIGCGRRARNDLMKEFFTVSHEQNAIITAVCDVWKQSREEAANLTQERYGQEPEQFENYKDLLSKSDVDAVIIATPEHQHCTQLEAAARAGKDAYCEKPLAMNMQELIRAYDAVKETQRIVQIGTQLRSWPSFTGCKKVVQEGAIGPVIKVEQVRNGYEPYWFGYVRPIEKEDTNWQGFLFNQEDRPFDPDQHTAWYGYRDFSIGPIASMMSHFIDLVHYISGAQFPQSAVTMAGTYAYKDQRTMPDSMQTLIDYPEGFMVSFSASYGNGGGNYTRFFGTKGMIDTTDWRKPILSPGGSQHPERVRGESQVPDVPMPHHMENWLQCIRTREQPNASIDAGYQHAIACILANEALKSNCRAVYDHKTRSVNSA